MEVESHASRIKHDRVRKVLEYFDIESNIEICSFSDIPTKGTGLGSSSAFTVGLINAVADSEIDRWSLADLACHIEIDWCKEPIGKQDQYASAYGGLNQYTFHRDMVYVDPIQVTRYVSNELNRRLMFFSTGMSRSASSVLQEQVNRLAAGENVNDTQQLVDMARVAKTYLENSRLDDFGKLLDDAWYIKKRLSSNISNPYIDEMYVKALEAGALGGKILGAGNGGFLMLYVPPHLQGRVREAMAPMEERKFQFTQIGSTREKLS